MKTKTVAGLEIYPPGQRWLVIAATIIGFSLVAWIIYAEIAPGDELIVWPAYFAACAFAYWRIKSRGINKTPRN